MNFNVNFNVFFKLIKVHLLVSEFFTRDVRKKACTSSCEMFIIYV